MKERRLSIVTPKKPVDIVFFGIIMAVTLVLSIVGIYSDILTVLAFITVFFIPGYAIQAAIFPASRIIVANKMVPDVLERLAISFVLSFLVIALSTSLLTGGLSVVLVDFSKDTVTSIVLMVTAMASIIAVDRRLAVPKQRAFKVVLVIEPHAMNGAEKVFAIAIVVLIAIAGINAIAQLNSPSGPPTFTTFAIYGLEGNITSLPNEIIAGNATSMILSIECKENHDTQYRLIVTLDNRSWMDPASLNLEGVNALHGGIGYYADIGLSNGEVWTKTFQFSISDPGIHKLFLQLNVPGESLRELWLWVNVT
jgi:uncharacterized membrane protein